MIECQDTATDAFHSKFKDLSLKKTLKSASFTILMRPTNMHAPLHLKKNVVL
jgi:hypothetical protein